ncbi:MAG: GNAT family N-acetyltransferase [Thermoplasmata archaeon]
MDSSLDDLEIGEHREAELAAIVDYYGSGDDPVDPFGDVVRLRSYLRHGRLMVARVHGDFAGFLFYRITRSPWYDEAHGQVAIIDELHVMPLYRRRGVATSLMRKALREIGTKGVHRIYIEAATVPSLRLYKALGFKPIRVAYFLRRDL